MSSTDLLRKLACVSLVTGFALSAAWSQGAKVADPRLAKPFEDAGVEYAVTDSGALKLTMPVDGERTHIVLANSETNEFGGLEVREVWAAAAFSESAPSCELLGKLLQQNSDTILGAWRIQKAGNRTLLAFAIQLAADAEFKTLLMAMKSVGQTADAVEKELTGKDDL